METPIEGLGGRVEDFADTTAIMQHLALVIISDFLPANMAGALDVTVWVALPFSPD